MEDPVSTLMGAFPGLLTGDAIALARRAQVGTYPAGTPLCREGHLEYIFYVVLVGEVEVTARMEDGGARLLARLGPGRFFGEMSLIEDLPRSATVAAATETTVFEVSKATFASLLEENPAVAGTVLRTVAANLRNTGQATITDLSRKNRELEDALRDLKAAQAELVARERMARDLAIAAEVQQNLLPQGFPEAAGWSVYGCNVAAREVGGDYFDAIRLDDRRIALVLADVADKSVQAALYMAVLRTLFVAESKRGLSPRETMLAVHRGFFDAARHGATFATAFYGVLDLGDGSLRYVRAGHELPIVVRAAGGMDALDADGRFIGMVEDLDLEERRTTLEPGDVLLVYSDGVPDAVDLDYASYGMDRFRHVAQRHARASAAGLCDRVFEDVRRYRGNAPAQDDITLLVAKREPGTGS